MSEAELIAHYNRHFAPFKIREAHRLPGEVVLNFRAFFDNSSWLVKVIPPQADYPFGERALQHVGGSADVLDVPLVLGSKDLPDGRRLRVQTWIEGTPLSRYRPHTPALREQWGEETALVNNALRDLPHEGARKDYRWDPSRTLDMRARSRFFTPEQRDLADHFWRRFERHTLPALPDLEKAVIYGDAHGDNLLVNDEGILTGLIDFGDVMYTHRLNELAIACAYAAMDVPDPVSAILDVVRGYRRVQRVDQSKHLLSLLTARLLITVSLAAERAVTEPDNEYHQVSAAPAWRLLRQLRTVHPTFLDAQLQPGARHQLNARLLDYARQHARAPVDLAEKSLLTLDLSVGSLQLGNYANYVTEARFSRHVRRLLEDDGADFAVGGYGEVRPVYTTDAFAETGNEGPRWRSVHLGLDVWGPAGTPIVAPLAGKIHSFGVDQAARGYGPTIILEHALPDDTPFFTLYGHLSGSSLDGLSAGTQVQGGEEIARFGDPGENGGWPPHLHFQVITDLLGNRGDFPGVAFPEFAEGMRSLCPPPEVFFGLPESAPTRVDMPDISRRRQQVLGPELSVSYARPLHIVRGVGPYLLDTKGRRYLDTVNNVAHVGHEHPAVVNAIQRQAAVLNTNTRYLHEEVLAFAEELTALLPEALSVVHFVNSGSEANDLALRMCEVWSGTRDMLALEVGYHGHTTRLIDVSAYKFDRAGGRGRPPSTDLLPLPDRLRSHHLDAAAELRQLLAGRDRPYGGFIGESILSCGGQVPLPDGYLGEVYRAVREGGGLCVADEVQTGLGRVGTHWWAFERQGVVPDIVTIGKPLGNGHPVAAVVCTREVADRFNNGMEYFNTFGGNPVSCAAGRAVLRVIQEEGLREAALTTGNYLTAALRQLADEYPLVADVRGAGLFLGIELAEPGTLAPATGRAKYLKNRMRQLGILMSTDGPHESVLKIKPPLCFGPNHADRLIGQLHEVFHESPMQLR